LGFRTISPLGAGSHIFGWQADWLQNGQIDPAINGRRRGRYGTDWERAGDIVLIKDMLGRLDGRIRKLEED
jgi:hypothetical protein